MIFMLDNDESVNWFILVINLCEEYFSVFRELIVFLSECCGYLLILY